MCHCARDFDKVVFGPTRQRKTDTGVLSGRRRQRFNAAIGIRAQERSRRAGTENLPAIVGMGAAIELITAEMPEETPRMTALRDKLIRGILDAIPESRLNGHPTQRLPGNVNISVRYIEGESLLLSLDMAGIAASSGSACTSGSLEPSHVLHAMGVPFKYAHSSTRLSLSRYNTQEEVDFAISKFPEIIATLRKLSPFKD